MPRPVFQPAAQTKASPGHVPIHMPSDPQGTDSIVSSKCIYYISSFWIVHVVLVPLGKVRIGLGGSKVSHNKIILRKKNNNSQSGEAPEFQRFKMEEIL